MCLPSGLQATDVNAPEWASSFFSTNWLPLTSKIRNLLSLNRTSLKNSNVIKGAIKLMEFIDVPAIYRKWLKKNYEVNNEFTIKL